MKINDRVMLGLVAGFAGNLVKTAIDEISLRGKISQRSFRETASGVWVDKRSEATDPKGQVLGSLFDFGMSSLGGVGVVHLLSKTGRDHVIAKGVVSGITIGSTITAALSVFPANKVRPKDAASNLSYMVAHAAYGVVVAAVAAYAGDPALFDAAPINDYIPSDVLTTEEQKMRDQAGRAHRPQGVH